MSDYRSQQTPVFFNMLPPPMETEELAEEGLPKSNGWPWLKFVALFGGMATAAVAGSLVYHSAIRNSMAADPSNVSVASSVDFGGGCILDTCQLLALANENVEDYTCKNFKAAVTLDSFLLDAPLQIQAVPFSGSVCSSAAGEIVPLKTNELNLRWDPVVGESGCSEDNFTGFPKGGIALIQRGSCFFIDKAKNAEKAGASGVIIFNQGNNNSDWRSGLYACQPDTQDFAWNLLAANGTCGLVDGLRIPVVFVSFESGVKLSVLGGRATISQSQVSATAMDVPANVNAFPVVRSGAGNKNLF
eukprot:g10970.t1